VWEPLAVQEVRLVGVEALGIARGKPGLDWVLRGLESGIFWVLVQVWDWDFVLKERVVAIA
jgi:hypothetical protein